MRGRRIPGPEQVLDRERDAMQWSADPSLRYFIIGLLRLGQGLLAQDRHIALKPGVDGVDPRQHRLGDFHR